MRQIYGTYSIDSIDSIDSIYRNDVSSTDPTPSGTLEERLANR
ncbi:MAG: hypothetical protein QW299_08640 [Candidatus Caldarchaeum sp.]